MSIESTPVPSVPASGVDSNWGRWGASDERGALNLLSEDVVKKAVDGLRGKVYSLAYPLDRETPKTDDRNHVWHTARLTRHPHRDAGHLDDVLTMHTHIGTHIDALCHSWEADGLYNGFDHREITSDGSPHLGVDHVGAIATRALVLDVSAVCPPGQDGWGFEITVEHLESALEEGGLRLEVGDVVLIHTGWSRTLTEDRATYTWGEPGIGPAAAEWLARHDVVMVGADNWAVEAVPPAVRGVGLPVHRTLLNSYGIYILENVLLTQVVAERGTCAGFIVVAPMKITGGAGSPVTPVLIC